MSYRPLVATAIFLAGMSLPAAAQNLTAGTHWINERGSELVIAGIDSPTGAITGTYTTMVAGFPCRSTPYPVSGHVSGDRIAWTVNYRSPQLDCMAMNVFAGLLVNGALVTEWQVLFHNPATSQPARGRGMDTYMPKK